MEQRSSFENPCQTNYENFEAITYSNQKMESQIKIEYIKNSENIFQFTARLGNLVEEGKKNQLCIRTGQKGDDQKLKPPPKNENAKRILIVEDHQVYQKILKLILETENCLCTIANNGEEALILFDSETFDLIFMDIEMPVMNGYDATKRIREKEKVLNLAPMPIVCLSSNKKEECEEKVFAAGMNAFIAKPFKKGEILEKMKQFMNKGTELISIKLEERNFLVEQQNIKGPLNKQLKTSYEEREFVLLEVSKKIYHAKFLSTQSTFVPLEEKAYQEGWGYSQQAQYEKALMCFKEAAEQQYPAAYLWLGYLYENNGLIGPKNLAESAKWYDKAREKIDWFKKQAESGQADAQANLGYCYNFGIGVEKDVKEAVRYYRLAAEQGDGGDARNMLQKDCPYLNQPTYYSPVFFAPLQLSRREEVISNINLANDEAYTTCVSDVDSRNPQ